MRLLELIQEITRDEILKKYVEDSKLVDQQTFEDIEKVTKGKLALTNWMLLRIKDRLIKKEDVYKWEEYFDIFNRNKAKFEKKDIGQVKTSQDMDKFIETITSIKDTESKDPSQKKGVSKSDKYAKFKIGEVDGFDVYKIPKDSTSEEYYKMSCELGSGTEWCTATGRTDNWFQTYIKQGPLYIFIKPGTDEKYQFHYESGQFMDKNDRSVI